MPEIDKGLILFGFILGIIFLLAAIFASSIIPTIFKTEKIAVSFNQSQLELIQDIKKTINESRNLSEESRQQSALNVNMTEINAKNIQNVLNNISEINKKLNK